MPVNARLVAEMRKELDELLQARKLLDEKIGAFNKLIDFYQADGNGDLPESAPKKRTRLKNGRARLGEASEEILKYLAAHSAEWVKARTIANAIGRQSKHVSANLNYLRRKSRVQYDRENALFRALETS